MNKDELEYIKENYFPRKRQQGFNLDLLMETINEIYEFELVSVQEAQALKRVINALCSEDSIERA